MQIISLPSPVPHPTESSAQATAVTDKPVPLAELLSREQPVVVVPVEPVKEIGGRKDGPEPTRFGDWEKNGRCIDF